MKRIAKLICILLILPCISWGQNYPHYTMFMFNKLIYNPAYAGSRDVASIDGTYRTQWTGINGAPKSFNASFDAPVGDYMKDFRHVALGVSIGNDQLGVTSNTNFTAYYAYRIRLGSSILSLGLQAGASMYSANYSQLNPYQQNDLQLTNSVKNAMLPNFGAGAYWYNNNFFAGFSVPNMLQDYYDKTATKNDNVTAREIRSYFLNGGYVFTLNDALKLEPQVMARYAGNADYQLPFNADINLSLIIYDRLLVGFTYRTDKSVEGVVHIQATRFMNIGYAYDYTASALNGYTGGTHEVVLGFNFVRDNNKYSNPRFVKMF